MRTSVLGHLADHELLRGLAAIVAQDRTTTAALLAHIAECDERKLFAPAGFPSMHAYCVHELGMSEDVASKRIHAARAARAFPAIFAAVAEGQLHLSGVCLLAPHLRPENAKELLTAAAHKTRSAIELLIARRFPRSESLALVQKIPGGESVPGSRHAPGHVEHGGSPASECRVTVTDEHAARHTAVVAPGSTAKPLAPGRYELYVSLPEHTYDNLEYSRALLGHALPSGDIATVIDLALEDLVAKLEKQKFGATRKPRANQRHASMNPRHIPASVKRAVWQRDQGQCSFVSETGHRCRSGERLEFDHIDPVARGGEATVQGLRLLCQTHNQYEAECAFGSGFINRKREEARSSTTAARARRKAQTGGANSCDTSPASHATRCTRASTEPAHDAAAAEARGPTVSKEDLEDVVTCLRQLKFSSDEARRAATFCATLPDISLEARVRRAIGFLAPKARFQGRAGPTVST